MPSLLQQPFSKIIPLLPVGEHSENLVADKWRSRFTAAGQQAYFDAIFNQGIKVRISRVRLLNFQGGSCEQKCLEIMLWGYPRGTRGKQTQAFLKKVSKIAALAPSSASWPKYFQDLKTIGNLGISTISKLAYFFQRSFEGHKALILDQKVIDVCASCRWNELQQPNLTYNNAGAFYLKYLCCMEEIAGKLHCRSDQVECFLFFFGKAF
jgi:hypothetical protein